MTQRSILLALLTVLATSASAFDFSDVQDRAEKIAEGPYEDHRAKVPDWMLLSKGTMTYDQWRDIRFRPDRSLWRDRNLPFEAQFFHPGLYYDRSVSIHVVDGEDVRELPYSREYFDYGKNDFADSIPADVGYAGFRIHYPIKDPAYRDEVVVFLGASYFRALGRDNLYGLSARGLALDTVELSGEEFPNFSEFWLVTPTADATAITIWALMESPSVTGAYRFVVTPGVETTVDVEARLYPRKPVRRFGVAPLTSMFFFGENSRRRFDDFRPEVHDSDGLLLHFESGEWLWRPLDNPNRIDVSALRMKDPRGFGLIQRDRDFRSHQDLETNAQLRPSAWIEPKDDWGKGQVQLVLIPSDNELVDNVVAFWVPDKVAKPGKSMDLAYRISWYGDDPNRPPGGRVIATRQDKGTREAAGSRRYVIDFAGGRLGELTAENPPDGTVSAADPKIAKVVDVHLTPNPSINGWRLAFQVEPLARQPIELRAFLAKDGDVLTETWSLAMEP